MKAVCKKQKRKHNSFRQRRKSFKPSEWYAYNDKFRNTDGLFTRFINRIVSFFNQNEE